MERTLMAMEVSVEYAVPGLCSLMPGGTETTEEDHPNQYSAACADIDDVTAKQALVDNAPKVVEDLSLLLADGRFSEHTKGLLEAAYIGSVNTSMASTTAEQAGIEALHVVQEIAMSVPEFHTTNLNNDAGPRTARVEQQSFGREFKAIVVVNFHGGADSFNFLVPHSNCSAKDMYQEYSDVRGNVAIKAEDLLQINVPPGTQPCNTFGLNKQFVNAQQFYNDGDASWVANVGSLVEPITPEQFKAGQKQRPPSLFGHAQQRQQVQTSHVQNPNAKGVLGRAVGALMKQAEPYKSSLFDVGGGQKILTGAPISPISVSQYNGLQSWSREGSLLQKHYENITQRSSGSIYAETYADSLGLSLYVTRKLGAELEKQDVTTNFPITDFGRQLKMAARMIKVGIAEGTERSAFMTASHGYDTHSAAEDEEGPILTRLMGEVDEALGAFVAEMKLLGLWDQVVIMSISDFGRALKGNSGAGTDHAWGGNNVILGGALNGSKIFGEYPPTLTLGEGRDIGHGRLVPTMGWEGMWSPIFEWFGVDQESMHEVLPNMKNFPSSALIQANELFRDGGDVTPHGGV
jgi:cullin-associated NEDD8-dissociated protein 1